MGHALDRASARASTGKGAMQRLVGRGGKAGPRRRRGKNDDFAHAHGIEQEPER